MDDLPSDHEVRTQRELCYYGRSITTRPAVVNGLSREIMGEHRAGANRKANIFHP